MVIRPLSQDDAAVYTAFLRDGVQKHARCFRITPDDVAATPVPFPAVSEDDFTLGAFSEDNALQGVVSFARDKFIKLRHKGLLYRMYVCTEAAGQGIGRQLIRAVIARASGQVGLEQITLTVVAHNDRAKRLYASEGFVSFALEPRSIKHGDEYLDEEQMVRFLNTEL